MLHETTGRPRLGIFATLLDLVTGHVPDGSLPAAAPRP
jgi:hypothetical protein